MEESERLWNIFLDANAAYARGQIPFSKRQEALDKFRSEFLKNEGGKNGSR